jgi:hypothetical protein
MPVLGKKTKQGQEQMANTSIGQVIAPFVAARNLNNANVTHHKLWHN